MHKYAVTVLAFILIFAVACNPSPTQVVDVTEEITALESRIEALEAASERQSVQFQDGIVGLSDQISGMEANFRSDIAALTREALDLQALMTQPLDLSRVDTANLTGLVVETTPPDAPLDIQPGACDGPLEPRTTLPAGAVTSSTFFPAPSGPHCVSIAETDEHRAAGVTVDVMPGSIMYVSIIPFFKSP